MPASLLRTYLPAAFAAETTVNKKRYSKTKIYYYYYYYYCCCYIHCFPHCTVLKI